MRRSLALKLTLAFLLVSLLGIALVAALAGLFTAREFGEFARRRSEPAVAAALAQYYREHGAWEGVAASGVLGSILPGAPPERFWPRGAVLADASGRVVAPGREMGDQLPPNQAARAFPVEVDGQTVGLLLLSFDEPRSFPPPEIATLQRINRIIVLAALGAAVVALLAGGLLARALTRPLQALTRATQAVARGELEHQVPVGSRDEIGELAESFNRMSAELGRASRLRRRMAADVAHELRTPLSLIRAHAEALRDGVLPPSVDSFSLIHDEAVRLNRLVDDLRMLSMADAGELQLVRRTASAGHLLERAVAAHRVRAQQQGVHLSAEIAPDLPQVDMDTDRMAQVMANLLDNALRHTPPGGYITCRAVPGAPPGERVILSVSDTGPGIAPEDLPNIFERFYRADVSRQRDGSGSGLGLAIAKSLVEAHGGRIWVESAAGAGTRFSVELPAVGTPLGQRQAAAD